MIRFALDKFKQNAPLDAIYSQFLLDPWVNSQLNLKQTLAQISQSASTDDTNNAFKKLSTSSPNTAASQSPPLSNSDDQPIVNDVPNPGLFIVASAIYGASIYTEQLRKDMKNTQHNATVQEAENSQSFTSNEPDHDCESEYDDAEYQTRNTMLWNYQKDVDFEKDILHQQIIAEYILARLYSDVCLIGSGAEKSKTSNHLNSVGSTCIENSAYSDGLLEYNPFFAHFLRLYIHFPQLRYLIFRILNSQISCKESLSLSASSVLNNCVKVAYDLRGNQLSDTNVSSDPLNGIQLQGRKADHNNIIIDTKDDIAKNVYGGSALSSTLSQQANPACNTENIESGNKITEPNTTAQTSFFSTDQHSPTYPITTLPKGSGPNRKYRPGWIAGLPISWIKRTLKSQSLTEDEISEILTPTDPIDILDRLEDIVSAPLYATVAETERINTEAKLALSVFQQSEDGEKYQDGVLGMEGFGRVNTIYIRNILPLTGVDPITINSLSQFDFTGLSACTKENTWKVDKGLIETKECDSKKENISSLDLVKQLYKSKGISEKKIQRQIISLYKERFVSLIKCRCSVEPYTTRSQENVPLSGSASSCDPGTSESSSPPMLTSPGVITEIKKYVLETLLTITAQWRIDFLQTQSSDWYDQYQDYDHHHYQQEGISIKYTKKLIRKSLLDAICEAIDPNISNEAVDFFFKVCVSQKQHEQSWELSSEAAQKRHIYGNNSDIDCHIIQRGDELREFVYGVVLRWLEGANSETMNSNSELYQGDNNVVQEGNLSEIRLICLVIKALYMRGQLEPKHEYNLMFGFFMRYIGQVKEAREVYFLSQER